MADLPRPIAEFLLVSAGLDRSPAYLQMADDGSLLDWGGQLAAYGIAGLERGRPAAEQVVVLQGMLPTGGRETCLPCVRIGEGAPADVYLFRDRHTDWALLLDASAFDRRAQPARQAANERSLRGEPPPFWPELVRALDMAVLEPGPDGRLAPVGDSSTWVRAVNPGGSCFLENFLIDAEGLWRLDCDGASVRSGPWHEDGLMPPGEWWEATALRLSGRNLIVLSRSFPASAERQRLLQTSRERELDLAARSDVLEVEAAALQRAAARNRLLAHAVESTRDMLCVTDLEDRFTFVNNAFLQAYGYAEHEVLGRHVGLVVSPANHPDVMANVLRSTRSEGWTGEVLNRRKDGSDFHVSLTTSQIRDGSGTIIGLLGVARDITERKETVRALRETEERLRQAQKMEAVGRLAGGVAHDFNNLLTVMTGFTEMALSRIDPADPASRDMEQVQLAITRAAALTRQLLAFSRRQLLAPKLIDINDLVGHLGSMLRRLIGEDVRLTITPSPAPARATADVGQLEQVIMNLAVNARDAMPDGGALGIEITIADLGEGGASRFGVLAGRYVTVAVTDTGHGMDSATLSRLFEPFFTTKPDGQGTGLGLATTYGILRQSGGGICVDSTLGLGSRLTFCLPAEPEASVPSSPEPAPGPGAGGSECILLVEDETAVRQLLALVLKNRGYEVMEAASGEEAIQLMADRRGPIQLVLSDTVMPGMGGRELAEHVAQRRPDTRVLLMSGYTDDWQLRCQIRDRHIAFLQKPFSPDALARKVREALDAD